MNDLVKSQSGRQGLLTCVSIRLSVILVNCHQMNEPKDSFPFWFGGVKLSIKTQDRSNRHIKRFTEHKGRMTHCLSPK